MADKLSAFNGRHPQFSVMLVFIKLVPTVIMILKRSRKGSRWEIKDGLREADKVQIQYVGTKGFLDPAIARKHGHTFFTYGDRVTL